VKALGRHVAVLGDQSIRVTASVGLTMFDHLSAIEVLACADLAMYEAKQAGRNRFALYHPGRGGRRPVSGRLTQAEHLRTALEQGRFVLYSTASRFSICGRTRFARTTSCCGSGTRRAASRSRPARFCTSPNASG